MPTSSHHGAYACGQLARARCAVLGLAICVEYDTWRGWLGGQLACPPSRYGSVVTRRVFIFCVRRVRRHKKLAPPRTRSPGTTPLRRTVVLVTFSYIILLAFIGLAHLFCTVALCSLATNASPPPHSFRHPLPRPLALEGEGCSFGMLRLGRLLCVFYWSCLVASLRVTHSLAKNREVARVIPAGHHFVGWVFLSVKYTHHFYYFFFLSGRLIRYL